MLQIHNVDMSSFGVPWQNGQYKKPALNSAKQAELQDITDIQNKLFCVFVSFFVHKHSLIIWHLDIPHDVSLCISQLSADDRGLFPSKALFTNEAQLVVYFHDNGAIARFSSRQKYPCSFTETHVSLLL